MSKRDYLTTDESNILCDMLMAIIDNELSLEYGAIFRDARCKQTKQRVLLKTISDLTVTSTTRVSRRSNGHNHQYVCFVFETAGWRYVGNNIMSDMAFKYAYVKDDVRFKADLVALRMELPSKYTYCA